MQIIGISGKAGSGKNTVAGFLASLLNEQGYSVRIDSFAGGLKKLVRENFGWKGQKDDFWRRVLQEFGMHKRDLDKDHWICDVSGRLLRRSQYAPDFVIITDVRMSNEAEFIRNYGKIITLKGRGGLTGENANHVTEKLNFETTDEDLNVLNDGSLEDLKSVLEYIVLKGMHLSKRK